MRNFFTVLKFEYLGMVRPKSFLITTIVFALILLAAVNLPLIMGLIRGGGDDAAPGQTFHDRAPGVFYDATGWYTPEFIESFSPQFAWAPIADPADIEPGLEEGRFAIGMRLTAAGATVYAPGGDLAGISHGSFWEMIRSMAQIQTLEAAGVDGQTIHAVIGAEPFLDLVVIGRDGGQGQLVAMVFTILLMIMVSAFGAIVAQSVGTEKTSKAIELLTISTGSNSLIFGKVLGVVLVALTQFGLILVPVFTLLYFNLGRWHEFAPMIGAMMELIFTSNILGLAFLFFLLSFFTYAFIFAALSSTVSRPEDLGSAQSLPSMLLMLAYFAALLAPESWLRVLSYVPFFSPLVMMARATMTEVPALEIALSAGVSFLYVLALGFLAAKIYRIGIMLTGNAPSLRQIFKLLRQS